jgi:hypothetical protein
MKKLLALLLATLMLVSLVACSDKTEEQEDLHDYLQTEEVVDYVKIGDDIFHVQPIDTETIAITKYEGIDAPHAVKVPAQLVNRKVVKIDEYAFRNCTAITSVELPDTLESIGQYAFAGCLALESITLPKTVETLAVGAFVGCTRLKSVVFEDGSVLTEINQNTFNSCSALESIAIPTSVKTVGVGAFFNCKALETVTIAEGVEKLGAQAFQGCAALKSLKVPATLTVFETTEIDGNEIHMVFAGCESLYLDGIEFSTEGSVAETYFAETIGLAQSAPATEE